MHPTSQPIRALAARFNSSTSAAEGLRTSRAGLGLCAIAPRWWACALLALGLQWGPAAAQLLQPEFQVNSYTTDAQIRPSVAADPSGNFIVVWDSSYSHVPMPGGQDGSKAGVFGQRFDAMGTAVGSEFQVNTYTTGNQFYPAVAANSNGGFVVVWRSNSSASLRGQAGSGTGVFGQLFSPQGTPVGNELLVNSFTPGWQGEPSVAMGGSGEFIVVWEGTNHLAGPSLEIFGQRFGADGSKLGSEFQVNTNTLGAQRRPDVATTPSGGFVVVWRDGAEDASGQQIAVQRYDSAGLPLGGPFVATTFTNGWQNRPKVAVDEAGRFVVVWDGLNQDGSESGVFARRFSAAGEPQGGEFQLNSYTTSHQAGPRIAMDGSGDFLVTWSSYTQDGSGAAVIAQRFTAGGEKVGGELQINASTTGDQSWPVVANTGPGSFVFAWSDALQDGSGPGIFGAQMATSIFRDGFEAADACLWSTAVGGGCP